MQIIIGMTVKVRQESLDGGYNWWYNLIFGRYLIEVIGNEVF